MNKEEGKCWSTLLTIFYTCDHDHFNKGKILICRSPSERNLD